jgi:hypothetical protein
MFDKKLPRAISSKQADHNTNFYRHEPNKYYLSSYTLAINVSKIYRSHLQGPSAHLDLEEGTESISRKVGN